MVVQDTTSVIRLGCRGGRFFPVCSEASDCVYQVSFCVQQTVPVFIDQQCCSEVLGCSLAFSSFCWNIEFFFKFFSDFVSQLSTSILPCVQHGGFSHRWGCIKMDWTGPFSWCFPSSIVLNLMPEHQHLWHQCQNMCLCENPLFCWAYGSISLMIRNLSWATQTQCRSDLPNHNA